MDFGRPDLSFGGEIDFENHFALNQDERFESANLKNEFQLKLYLKAGYENLFLYAVPAFRADASRLEYKSDEDFSYKGLANSKSTTRISDNSAELEFDECYLHYFNNGYQVRIGNQIISWGTGDFFNPTAYFNPYDMREAFTKETDEQKFGVTALSAIRYFDNATLEFVWAPIHAISDRVSSDLYWGISPENYSLPVIVLEDGRLESDPDNYGYGVRVTTTAGLMDLSASFYHGPDNEPVYIPEETRYEEGTPLAVLVAPEYFVVNKYGIDMVRQFEKFVIQAEAVYSPDKVWTIEQDLSALADIEFPFDTTRTEAFSYTFGFNYFVPVADYFPSHEGELVFTFGWYDAIYFDDSVMPPVMSDYIGLRLEDTFWDGRLSVVFNTLIDIENVGSLIWPQVGYDFQNGFSFDIEGIFYDGKSGERNESVSLFRYLKDNDTAIVRLKYAF